MKELIYTTMQAARYLGVSQETVRRWTKAGHMTCYRTPGGQYRYGREQLDGFLASRREGGVAQENGKVQA